MSFHSYFFQLIKGEKKGLLPSFLRGVLYCFSKLYKIATYFHKTIYKLHIKKSYRPNAYTISIGNITAGGTGKTPVTIFLGEKLSKKLPVGVLLRGYRVKGSSPDRPISSEETKDPKILGDEAALISKKLSQVEVISCSKRKDAAILATNHGKKLLLLDDGMQHYAICRDFEIVILDGYNPFGYGYLLPRGLLRENLRGLKRADLIIINHSSSVNSDIKEKIRRYNKSAPIIQAGYKVKGYYDLHGNKHELSESTKVSIFCAVGNPHSFFKLVQTQGLDVKSTLYIRDHAFFKDDELEEFSQQAKNKGASFLITTEKDAIKLSENLNLHLPILVLNIELEVRDGSDILDSCIKKWEDEAVKRLSN